MDTITQDEVARLRHNMRVVETETFWDCKIYGLSKPRLFETLKCQGCWDWDFLRLRNLQVVETKTLQDWSKVVQTEIYIFIVFIDLSLKYIIIIIIPFWSSTGHSVSIQFMVK